MEASYLDDDHVFFANGPHSYHIIMMNFIENLENKKLYNQITLSLGQTCERHLNVSMFVFYNKKKGSDTSWQYIPGQTTLVEFLIILVCCECEGSSDQNVVTRKTVIFNQRENTNAIKSLGLCAANLTNIYLHEGNYVH